MLGLLRRDASIRHRFPHALSDGSAGAFAAWVCQDLPQASHAFVREAFEGDPTPDIIEHFIHDY
jgi:hypothetical protein